MDIDDDLVAGWTLVEAERRVVLTRRGAASRLGFALLLRFYGRSGRFPDDGSVFTGEVVDFVARQLGLDAGVFAGYRWSGRTFESHRAEVRRFFGFAEFTVGDADRVVGWLAGEVCERERNIDRVREALAGWCLQNRLEPPSAGRVDRIVRSALHRAELTVAARVAGRLDPVVQARLDAVIAADSSGGDGSLWSLVVAPAGRVSLQSLLDEISKLEAVRSVGLPAGVLDDVSPVLFESWRARVLVESPSHVRTHPRALRLSMLAALLVVREREIIDGLVDLFIATVKRISSSAERRVTKELTQAFKRVTGKENILFSVAEAALEHPDRTVREVVFPAVNGGEQTLADLVEEFRSKGPVYQQSVRATVKASYSSHYRRGLIALLGVLEFDSNNMTHRPVLDGLDVVTRFADSRVRYYPAEVQVPLHRGVSGDWELSVLVEVDGVARVKRSAYEICTFQALREQLRCKEIWVAGADKWCNPDQDLPADFDRRRHHHYKALGQPLDPTVFIDDLRGELEHELDALHENLHRMDWVAIADRGRRGAISLSPIPKQVEPVNLAAIKAEVLDRWGVIQLIDVLKEAVLRSGCVNAVQALFGRGDLDRQVLAERLLLVIYAYGTNTGIRSVAGGPHGHTEDDLRYVRRRYLNPEIARSLAVEIANATFAARRRDLWGDGTGTVASDSTHFRAVDQNLFTEWHARYGGRGVLVYWHVEEKSVAIHSQLIACSASEVAAMIEGTMRHGTSMTVEGNYVDSHGQSEIGFGVTRLLGFKLLPRIKRINHVRLYPPSVGAKNRWPDLGPAMKARPIRWDVIGEQYDQMIRYATAIRTRSASTESILRRFMRSNHMHPTYQAMLEVGRAERTIFVARYLRDRDLQVDTQAGMNVVESWNGGNDIVFYGNNGQFRSNRRDEQELSMLCLHILQSALVYVNTLLLQAVLTDDRMAGLTNADRRALTPLFWSNVSPYGEVRLDMAQRIVLGQ